LGWIWGDLLGICEKWAIENLVGGLLASYFGRFFGVFEWIEGNRFSKICLFSPFFTFFSVFFLFL